MIITDAIREIVADATARIQQLEVKPDEFKAAELLLNFTGILQIVSYCMGVPPNDITGKCRKREITSARFLVLHFMNVYLPWTSLKEKAELIGYKEHTAVLHGLQTASDLLDTVDQKFTEAFEKCNQLMKEFFKDENKN